LAQINNLSFVKEVPGASRDNYLSNNINPYKIAGNVIEKASFKYLSSIIENKGDPDSLRNEFKKEISNNLPESILHPDTTDFNKFETTLETSMMGIYLNEGFDTAISKSMQIENIIICSDYLSDIQKKRVLIFSSVTRHNMGIAHQICSSSKNELNYWAEFAACFSAKFNHLNDCDGCWIEKAYCFIYWVECYGIWAADCLLNNVYGAIVSFFEA
jgi:hypothetical protein